MGCRRVPDPPARMMPFMETFLNKQNAAKPGLRCGKYRSRPPTRLTVLRWPHPPIAARAPSHRFGDGVCCNLLLSPAYGIGAFAVICFPLPLAGEGLGRGWLFAFAFAFAFAFRGRPDPGAIAFKLPCRPAISPQPPTAPTDNRHSKPAA